MPGLPNPFPVVRDLDTGIYVKGDAGRLVIGGFEPDAKVWDAYGPEGDRAFLEMPEDWDQFGPFMEAALALGAAARRHRHPALHERPRELHRRHPPLYRRDAGGRRPLRGGGHELGRHHELRRASARCWPTGSSTGAEPRDLWGVDIARADPSGGTPRT